MNTKQMKINELKVIKKPVMKAVGIKKFNTLDINRKNINILKT